MMKKKDYPTSPAAIADTIVVYSPRSERAGRYPWTGHSMSTDQVGTGSDVLGALTDGMRAGDATLAVAAQEPDIQVLRTPNKSVQRRAANAEELPEEIPAIAERMLDGSWPGGISVTVEAPRNRNYRAPHLARAR